MIQHDQSPASIRRHIREVGPRQYMLRALIAGFVVTLIATAIGIPFLLPGSLLYLAKVVIMLSFGGCLASGLAAAFNVAFYARRLRRKSD